MTDGNVTTAPRRRASPRLTARTAGVFYLLEMFTGGLAVLVVRKLVIGNDAAASAFNILAHESLFRLSFAANLLQFACYIAVTGLLYHLFRPVSQRISLLAAFFSLVGCAIGAVSCVFQLAPLTILAGAQYLNVFKAEQVQALALLFFKLYVQCFNVSFVFFGFYCLLIGSLIFRSTFLPRILGAGMAMAGLGWLTFLSPPLVNYLSPYILVPGMVGEGLLTCWLVIAGVNAQRWHEQAGYQILSQAERPID